jgi:hypothetical protein
MNDESMNPSPAPLTTDKVRQKTLEELIEQQGVAQTATFERLLGAGVDLWDDEDDFGRFLESIRAIRREKD